MHVEYSARALIATILLGTGCNEAIYTLGRLPGEVGKRNSCRDSSSAGADLGACAPELGGSVQDAARGFGGSPPLDASADRHAASGNGNVRDGSTSKPTGSSDACPDDRHSALRKGLNLYLLVDDSLSVVLQPAWNSLTLAISAFVDDPANGGVGVGIGYYGSSCNAADYSTPAVRVLPLPDNAAAIKASYPLPISGKALTPALTGGLAYARSLETNNPDREAALVLVTDGIGDPVCGSNATNAAQQIGAALQGAPRVRTYVIALGAGPTLLDPANIVDLTPLDDLASSGGTAAATRIEVNLSTNTELTAALAKVRDAAIPCAYSIPADVDRTRATLEWEPGATTIVWPRVRDAGACGNDPGVYVRADSPSYLELCPASCTAVKSGSSGTVFVRTACR